MNLYLTDRGKSAVQIRSPHTGDTIEPLNEAYRATILDEFGLVDGLPFFIRADGTYESEIARFFRFIATNGASSPSTLLTYARHISYWLRWLDVQERCWKSVSPEHFRAYYRVRRLSHENSASYWNVASAAIGRLYQFAYAEGIVKSNPFPQSSKRLFKSGMLARPSTGNGLKDKIVSAPDLFLTLEQYQVFRKCALTQKSHHPLRTSIRNAVLFDLLIKSGLRVSEALALELWELPDPDSREWTAWKSCTVRLRAETTKNKKSRIISIPKSTLREIGRYVDEDRALVIRRRMNRNPGTYKSPSAIWLTEDGDILNRFAVEKIFARISAKSGIKCTPHYLRHSFATYMLSRLISVLHRQLDNFEKSGDRKIYKDIIEDPLRKVQRLLGHSHISSTYRYLSTIQNRDPLTDVALCQWSEELDASNDVLLLMGESC